MLYGIIAWASLFAACILTLLLPGINLLFAALFAFYNLFWWPTLIVCGVLYFVWKEGGVK